MKNKFDVDKNLILELHKSYKTKKMVLREQSGDVKLKLQSMIDNNQIPDAVGVVELDTNDPNRMWAIKKKSKKNPGTFVYLFVDGKYGTFGVDKKFTFGSGIWKVDDVIKQEVKVDPKKEVNVQVQKEIPGEIKKDVIKPSISGDEEKTKDITTVNAEITQNFKQAVQSQTLPSKQQCRRDVESYYLAYKKKMEFDPKVFEDMKKVVQTCANQFEFSGPFTKTDNYLDILTGRVGGGPLSSSPWRIKR